MTQPSYSQQLFEERQEKRRVTRPWLECFLCQTAPSFEDCKEHFEKKGMLLTRADYDAACKKMFKTPISAKEKPGS